MKFYRNMPIFFLLLSILSSCSTNLKKDTQIVDSMLNNQEKIHDKKLAENFKYDDSPDIQEQYKILLKKHDKNIKASLQKAILYTFASNDLPKDIEQKAFDKGFIQSSNSFMKENFFEFFNTSDLDFSEKKLESLFIRIIQHGKSKSIF